MDDLQFNEIKEIINKSENIVFFGGAGMSTESGIPDFRSKDGLYNQKYDYPPEEILSNDFFYSHPDIFYEFYREKSLEYIIKAKPNAGHYKLAQWENQGKLKAVVTQNIDGLHQAAGSKNVLELHGCVNSSTCTKCGKKFDIQYIMNTNGAAYCDECHSLIHPDIVLYGEGLNQNILSQSISSIQNADVMIVAGTSLVVYPAAGLLNYYRGDKLILINKDPGVYDSRINYAVYGKAGEILSKL